MREMRFTYQPLCCFIASFDTAFGRPDPVSNMKNAIHYHRNTPRFARGESEKGTGCFFVFSISRMLFVLIFIGLCIITLVKCATTNGFHEQQLNQAITKVATADQSKADKNWKKADQWFKLRDRCFPPISTICNHMANVRGNQAAKQSNRSMAVKKH